MRSLAGERLQRLHPLRTLPGARDRLELYEANLLTPGSYDKCLEGATYVFHTASPFVTDGITDVQGDKKRSLRETTSCPCFCSPSMLSHCSLVDMQPWGGDLTCVFHLQRPPLQNNSSTPQ